MNPNTTKWIKFILLLLLSIISISESNIWASVLNIILFIYLLEMIASDELIATQNELIDLQDKVIKQLESK